MFVNSLQLTNVLLALARIVSGLGTTCTVPLGAGTSGHNDPFWMQSIKHQGTAPFNLNPSSYNVFRNVKVSTNPGYQLIKYRYLHRTLERLEMEYMTIHQLSSMHQVVLSQ